MPGEKVREGDTLRYQSSSSTLRSSPNEIYDVVKTELHYFEVEARFDLSAGKEPYRKVIKYMDIGYHISLEIWSGNGPFVSLKEE